MAHASARELRDRPLEGLEDIIEPDEKPISLASTERVLDAERGPHPAAGTQADPIVPLEASQFVQRSADGSGVVEERAGHELVDSPAVLRLEQHGRAIAVAERPVTAKSSRAAERRLQVERHLLIRPRTCRRRNGAKRNRLRVLDE